MKGFFSYQKGEQFLKKEEKTIGAGGSCFLIKDESLLKGWGSPVYRWLYDNGFVSWGTKGVYKGVDWVFVNPYSKVFAPGLRGYRVTSVVCEHAVTLEEFEVIYNIFKKYEGLDVLMMTNEEQEEHDKKWNAIEENQRKYVSELTYEKFFDEVKEKLAEYLKHRRLTEEELIAYMKKQEEVIIEAYEENKRLFTDEAEEWETLHSASSVAYCLDWLYE